MQSIKLHCAICTIKNVYKILYCSIVCTYLIHMRQKRMKHLSICLIINLYTPTQTYTHTCAACAHTTQRGLNRSVPKLTTDIDYQQVVLLCLPYFPNFLPSIFMIFVKKTINVWNLTCASFSLVMLFKSVSQYFVKGSQHLFLHLYQGCDPGSAKEGTETSRGTSFVEGPSFVEQE